MSRDAIYIFSFLMISFLWIMTFIAMMLFKSMYEKACARERRYTYITQQLTAKLNEQSQGKKPASMLPIDDLS